MKKHFPYSMAVSICIIFLPVILNFACKETTQKEDRDQQRNTNEVTIAVKKPPSSFNDTLFITIRSAVFYRPDSIQLATIKRVNKKNIYESLTHESFYQMRNAKVVLQKYWPQIKIIENSNCRWLVFIKADKSKAVIDLNSKNDISGIFLFDPKKDPELIDMMNIDTALGFYFEK
jgi:hypothetical protein